MGYMKILSEPILTSLKKILVTKFVLTRRVTIIARGLSILIIMLHNLVHVFPTIINEAEFNYFPELYVEFFQHTDTANPLLICDLLSFIGWYGVPVFIFLSGFGLAKRYGSDNEFNMRSFIWRNWRKLFFLILPAALIFTGGDIVHSLYSGRSLDYHQIVCDLIPLTELNGIFQNLFPVTPGVYWYIGVAFELYVIYALAVWHKPAWILWTITIVCYLVISIMITQKYVNVTGDLVYYLRHNFTGWMLPFACGIILGRRRTLPVVGVILAFILLAVSFLPLLKSSFGWQLADVAAICIIIGIAVVVDRIPVLFKIFTWVGSISGYLYVVHPIVRHFLSSTVFDFISPTSVPTFKITSVYIVMVFISALVYRYISQYLEHRKWFEG